MKHLLRKAKIDTIGLNAALIFVTVLLIGVKNGYSVPSNLPYGVAQLLRASGVDTEEKYEFVLGQLEADRTAYEGATSRLSSRLNQFPSTRDNGELYEALLVADKALQNQAFPGRSEEVVELDSYLNSLDSVRSELQNQYNARNSSDVDKNENWYHLSQRHVRGVDIKDVIWQISDYVAGQPNSAFKSEGEIGDGYQSAIQQRVVETMRNLPQGYTALSNSQFANQNLGQRKFRASLIASGQITDWLSYAEANSFPNTSDLAARLSQLIPMLKDTPLATKKVKRVNLAGKKLPAQFEYSSREELLPNLLALLEDRDVWNEYGQLRLFAQAYNDKMKGTEFGDRFNKAPSMFGVVVKPVLSSPYVESPEQYEKFFEKYLKILEIIKKNGVPGTVRALKGYEIDYKVAYEIAVALALKWMQPQFSVVSNSEFETVYKDYLANANQNAFNDELIEIAANVFSGPEYQKIIERKPQGVIEEAALRQQAIDVEHVRRQ